MNSRVWRDFGGGILLDAPAWQIGDGHLAEATNFLFDKPPMARRRSKVLGAGGTQGVSYRLGRHISSGGGVQLYTYGRQTAAGPTYAPAAYDWSPGGAESVVFASGSGANPWFFWSEPVMHLGSLIACAYSLVPDDRTFNTMLGVGGATHATASGSSTNVAVVVTAGSPRAQCASGWPSSGTPGMMIRIVDHAGLGGFHYVGRISGKTSSTEVLLEPTPTTSFTGNADISTGAAMVVQRDGNTQTVYTVGKILVSWQNRLVALNIRQTDTFAPSSASQALPNAFAWTIAPDELASGNRLASGNTALYQSAWERSNYDYIGSAYPITGAAIATNGNAVLIFTDTETFLLTGLLTSQTARGAGAQYDTPRLSTSVGCVASQTVVNTPLGIVWASSEGVYGFDGRIRDLMSGRMSRTWRNLIVGFGRADIHGAAYVNGHYFITIAGTPYYQGRTFFCNLQTLAWGELEGPALDVMHAVQSGYARTVYALRWWNEVAVPGGLDYSPAAPTIVDLNSVFADSDDGGNDCDGSALTATLTTGSSPLAVSASRGTAAANLLDYESYRSHRIAYRADETHTANVLTPQGGVDSRMSTGEDQALTLADGTGLPQVDMLSNGNILDRSISHRLDLGAGLHYFELHAIETRGDEIGSEEP